MRRAFRIVLTALFVSSFISFVFLEPSYGREQPDLGTKYLSRPVPPGFHGAKIYSFGQITPAGAGVGHFAEQQAFVEWSAVFPPCSELNSENVAYDVCIESLAARRIGESSWTRGTVTSWRPDPDDIVISESVTSTTMVYRSLPKFGQETRDGFPIGGLARVWSLQGIQHWGGTEYLLGVGFDSNFNVSRQMTNRSFSINLVPVSLGMKKIKSGQWPLIYGSAFEFADTHEFQVRIRMGKFMEGIGGWTQGRILDPDISIESNVLTISGKPSKSVIGLVGPLSCDKWPDLSTEGKTLCTSRTQSPIFNQTIGVGFGNSFESATKASNFYPEGPFEYWKSQLRAEGYSSSWSLVSLGTNRSGSCEISKGTIGIVSSDAMLYSTAPPVWDVAEQSLSYQVASVPKGPSGETIEGNFNVAIPRSFAICLWGLDVDNAVAQVSVTSSDGSPRVATSTLSRDSQNIYFKVSGFTFSSPKIKVRLIARKSPVASAVDKKKTVICVKGKKVLKVTAIKPKCPTGFSTRKSG